MRNKLFFVLLGVFLSITCVSAQLSKTIEVTTPGTLSTYLGDEKIKVTDLTLTGTINDTDFATIKQMTLLKVLDMSAVTIQNGAIPASAFASRSMSKIVLPSTLESIGNGAFASAKLTEPLVFPSGLQEIGSYAFYTMTAPSLDFTQSKNLVTIKDHAFKSTVITSGVADLSACQSLTTFGEFCFEFAKIHVILPSNLQSLSPFTFYNFAGSVTLPSTLESIGSNAFTLAKLTEPLVFPSGLQEIGSYAFYTMTAPSLDFTQSKNLVTIKDHAFKSTVITSGVADLSACQSLTTFGKFCFEFAKIHVILPSNLQSLSPFTFYNFAGSVTLPSTLESIGSNAFTLAKLTEPLVFPSGLQEIGSYAFYTMTAPSLDFTQSKNLVTIKDHAFKSTVITSGVADLSACQSLTTFGEFCFEFAKIHVILPSNLQSLSPFTFYNFAGSVTLPSTLESIGSNAFTLAKLTEPLVFPSGLQEIGSYAFYTMTAPSLDFTQSKNLVTIKDHAFKSTVITSGVADLSACQSLTTFGEFCFEFAKIHVILPSNLQSLSPFTFYNFAGSVTLPSTLESIGSNAFTLAKLTEPLVFPSGLQEIGSYAFYTMTAPSLDFTQSKNLVTIKDHAFKSTVITSGVVDLSACQSLTTFGGSCFEYAKFHVILPSNLQSLSPSAFAYFTGSVTLPSPLESIGNSAFASAKLTEPLVFPSGLKEIDSYAFNTMTAPSLDFTQSKNLTTIKNSAFRFASVTSGVVDLSACQSLTTFGGSCFEYAKFHVILPLNLQSLSPSAFAYFSGSVTLSPVLEVIGISAFYNSTIKEIFLPSSVKTISNSAFYGCSKLEQIVSMNPIPPALGTNVFYNVNKTTCKLYVPESSIELYQAAAQWKDFLIEAYKVILTGDLQFKKATGENLYQVSTGEKFEIGVYANFMAEVRLGLFEASSGSFIEDIVSDIKGNNYICQISTAPTSGSYIIQPYYIVDGEMQVISRSTGSHVIDRLLISVKNTWDQPSLRSAVAGVNNHILISTAKENLLEVASGKEFKVLVRHISDLSSVKVGLFNPATGVLVSNITKSVEGNIFACKVPAALADSSSSKLYTLIPYQEIEGATVYVERLENKIFLADRLPLYVTLGKVTEEPTEPEIEEPTTPEIEEPSTPENNVVETIDLVYTEDGGTTILAEYKGVRVGEYYWMNSNFNNPTDIPVTKSQIDFAHDTYEMFNKQTTSTDNKTYWDYLGSQMGISNLTETQIQDVLLPEFHKYYGTYYTMNRDRINKLSYVRRFGAIKEKVDGKLIGQDVIEHYPDWVRAKIKSKYWDLPTAADILQLIAMCGHGTMPEVRQFLSYKENEVPVAIVAPGMDWFYPNAMNFSTNTYLSDQFNASNTNKYKMNIVPNGFRWGIVKSGLVVKNEQGFVTLNNVAVDELVGAGLNQALTFPIVDKNQDNLNIEHRIFTSFQLGDHPVISYNRYPSADAIPMRWCRALTDAELGYKLYINQDMSEINCPESVLEIYAAMVGTQYSNRKRSGEEVLLEKVRNGIVKKEDISIVKLGLNDTAPSGYTELPRGYIRGFYVQYILDKPTPRKTVADLIDIATINPFLWIGSSANSDELETRIAELNTDIRIYPNPVPDVLYFESGSAISNLEMYSINGQRVLQQANVGSSISVAHLPNGTYVLKLVVDGKPYTHKIIKK